MGARVADPGAVRDRRDLHDSVKDCLRCGKCKPVCATHVPRANLLYSARATRSSLPRLLIEAFLYEEQTRRGVSLKHFDEFERCGRPLHGLPQVPANPCPVEDRLRRCVDQDAQPACTSMGQEALQPGHRRGDVLPERDQTRRRSSWCVQGHDRRGATRLQRMAYKALLKSSASGAAADQRHPPATLGKRQRSRRRSSTSSTSRCPVACPRRQRGRFARYRGQASVRTGHPGSATHDGRRVRGGVLFPWLRVGAPLQPSGPGDAGDALARGRCGHGVAAGVSVLRVPADRRSGQ